MLADSADWVSVPSVSIAVADVDPASRLNPSVMETTTDSVDCQPFINPVLI